MTDHNEIDKVSMHAAVAGNRDGLAELVDRHGDALLTFLVRMSGDRHRGEELFQETFLRVWSKRHTWKPHKPFKPWLYTIAANCCRNSFRRHEVAVSLGEGAPPVDNQPNPSDQAESDERAEMVLATVARLPEQQRMVVTLRIWNDLSFSEIAQVVSCTEATARSHMHHGLAKMRRLLEARV